MAKAQEAYERQEYERAVKLLDRVVARQPTLPEPHFMLGMIYTSPGWEEPVRGLYHWTLFLELAQNDERAQLARDLRAKQIVSLIGEVDATDSDSQDQVRNLARENARLDAEVKRLRAALAQASAAVAGAGQGAEAGAGARGGGAAAGGAGGRAAPAPEVYTVRRGDTLETIAQAVYGDRSRWQRILEANRSATFTRPEQLRQGMELKIPRPEGDR